MPKAVCLDSYADEQRIKSTSRIPIVKDSTMAWEKGDAFLGLQAISKDGYVRASIKDLVGSSSPSARVNGGDLFTLRYERRVLGFDGFIGTITIHRSALDGKVMMFSQADYRFELPTKILSRDDAVSIM